MTLLRGESRRTRRETAARLFALSPHISPVWLSYVRARLDYCTLLYPSTAVEQQRVRALSPLRPHLRRLSASALNTRTSPSAYARRARRTLATVKLRSSVRATDPSTHERDAAACPTARRVGQQRARDAAAATRHQPLRLWQYRSHEPRKGVQRCASPFLSLLEAGESAPHDHGPRR